MVWHRFALPVITAIPWRRTLPPSKSVKAQATFILIKLYTSFTPSLSPVELFESAITSSPPSSLVLSTARVFSNHSTKTLLSRPKIYPSLVLFSADPSATVMATQPFATVHVFSSDFLTSVPSALVACSLLPVFFFVPYSSLFTVLPISIIGSCATHLLPASVAPTIPSAPIPCTVPVDPPH